MLGRACAHGREKAPHGREKAPHGREKALKMSFSFNTDILGGNPKITLRNV